MYLGLDIGSSSSKAAVIDENGVLKCTAVVNRGTGTDGIGKAVGTVMKKADISEADIRYTVVTGYGRMTYEGADRQITEISCHARGVRYLMDDEETIIDIGGQDAKVIKLGKSGAVENFIMNEKCAAGTGRFLEVMARVLGCELDELSGLAGRSSGGVHISSTCTVFAESEAISQLAGGAAAEDVAKGAHLAVAERIKGMCSRISAGDSIIMTGGVTLNTDMVKTLSEVLGRDVKASPYPQAAGAIGAAVYAMEYSRSQD